MTLVEVCTKLKEFDEVTLLERLNISSEDIVERFEDKIDEQRMEFEQEFEEDEPDDS